MTTRLASEEDERCDCELILTARLTPITRGRRRQRRDIAAACMEVRRAHD